MFPIMGPGMSAELWKVLTTLIHKIMDPDEYVFLFKNTHDSIRSQGHKED